MQVTLRCALALILSTVSFAAFAQDRAPAPADPQRAERVAAGQSAQQRLRHADLAAKSTASVAAAQPGQPRVNPVRTYPPSCLADPLPDTPSGTLYRNENVLLAATDGGGNFFNETATVTIWRVACSSATTFNSATLMRVTRRPQFEGDDDVYALMPGIEVAQGTIGFGNSSGQSLIRVAAEPNTIISDVMADTPIIFSTTYVLENYPYVGAGFFDFNLPFSVRFDNFFPTNRYTFINNIPLYVPGAGTYPDAFSDLPLNGYLGANWYDRNNSGEGMFVRINENESTPAILSLEIAWYTFDNTGTPYWLYGGADFNRGARSVTAPVGYWSGGSFAGTGTGTSVAALWGSITMTFQSCNNMRFTFASVGGLPAGVPNGSGTRNFTRLGNQNGLPCE